MNGKKKNRKEIQELLDRVEMQRKDKENMGKRDKKKYIIAIISAIIILSILFIKIKNLGTMSDLKYRSDIKSYISQLEKFEDRYNKINLEVNLISNKLKDNDIKAEDAKKEIDNIIYESKEIEEEIDLRIKMPKKGKYETQIKDMKDNLLNTFVYNREGLENYIALIDLGGISPSQDPLIIKKYEMSNSCFNKYLVIKNKLEYYVEKEEIKD